MHATRRAAIGTTTLLLSLALAPGLLLSPALYAHYLLHELNTLEIGRSTFDDADRLARHLGGRRTLFAPCTRDYCEWERRISNHALPRWWRGTGATFAISFDVEHGVVARKGVGYGIGPTDSSFFPSSVGIEEQANWGRSPTPVPVSAGWSSTDLYLYYQ